MIGVVVEFFGIDVDLICVGFDFVDEFCCGVEDGGEEVVFGVWFDGFCFGFVDEVNVVVGDV